MNVTHPNDKSKIQYDPAANAGAPPGSEKKAESPTTSGSIDLEHPALTAGAPAAGTLAAFVANAKNLPQSNDQKSFDLCLRNAKLVEKGTDVAAHLVLHELGAPVIGTFVVAGIAGQAAGHLYEASCEPPKPLGPLANVPVSTPPAGPSAGSAKPAAAPVNAEATKAPVNKQAAQSLPPKQDPTFDSSDPSKNGCGLPE